MKRRLHSTPSLRKLGLFSFAGIFLFVGCGKKSSPEVKAEPFNPHSAVISWTASTSSVPGYNVYRVSPPGGVVKLTSKIVSGTQYTDRTAEAGHKYLYYVTSVDSQGNESKPSEKAAVTVPTTVTPPVKQ